jgi:hypothetical protein
MDTGYFQPCKGVIKIHYIALSGLGMIRFYYPGRCPGLNYFGLSGRKRADTASAGFIQEI